MPLRAVPDRLPAPGRRPHGPVQLAVRPPHRRASSSCGWRTPTPSATGPSSSTPSSTRSRWLGLDWDEEPVHQSDRLDAYLEAAAAPPPRRVGPTTATAPAEDVQARAKERGGPPGYDGFCRDRGLEPGDGRALRFRTPDDGVTAFDDVVRGARRVREQHARGLRAPPLERHARSSSWPTWSTTTFMGITHVIRGEDHLNGTPKYLLLVDALGLELPPGVRPPALPRQRAAQEALQAPGRRALSRLPRPGLPARGDAQLPGPARLGPARRRRDRAVRRDRRPCSASRTSPPRRRSSTPRSSTTSTPSTSGR